MGRQIKTAQARAGGISIAEVARKPNRPNKFSAPTIRRVVQNKRPLERHEADWLAPILGVDPEFFYAEPEPAAESQLDRIERRMEVLERQHQEVMDALTKAFTGRTEQGGAILVELKGLRDAVNGHTDRAVDGSVQTMAAAVAESTQHVTAAVNRIRTDLRPPPPGD